MTKVTFAPPVLRKLKLERAKELLGTRWLLHPKNHVKRLAQPYKGPSK